MATLSSHFFALLSRMRFIQRWGLMFNTYPENISEHSLRVAMIAHALAVIRNTHFAGTVNADRVAARALYHDVSEVLTGDLPAPVKYFNPDIRDAYKAIEHSAALRLLSLLPESLQAPFSTYLIDTDESVDPLIKAADKLCAYLKCIEEIRAGNQEFARAERTLRTEVENIDLAEVQYFVSTFVPSFRLTLDDIG